MIASRLRLTWLALCAAAAVAVGGEPPPANTWVRLIEGEGAAGVGAVLVHLPQLGRMICFGGEGRSGQPYVRTFDPAARRWEAFSPAKPPAKRGIHPYYQAAYDPKARRIYALSDHRLYVLDLAAKAWRGPEAVGALDGLSWPVAAIDADGHKLVVVGSDKRPDNLGWTRTAILDLDSGRWTTLPRPEARVVRAHRRLVAAAEAVGELAGRTRLAWFRDPAGAGTEAELEGLRRRCEAIGEMPGMDAFAEEVHAVAALLAEGKTLEALKAARSLHRELELAAERQYPVPPSRRNAPLAFDAKSKAFVLFGGDHEDYLTNDTWVLDLARGWWRRTKPRLAPSPRAGHALVYLPAAGKVALYGGYVQSDEPWYGARPWRSIDPRQLWLYDVGADRWELVAAWPAKGQAALPPAAAGFYGYHGQHYAGPALAADGAGGLVLAVPPGRGHKGSTWAIKPDLKRLDAAGRAKLAQAADGRLYRTGRFLAAYCEAPDPPKPTNLDALPANRWVKLPAPPRNVAYGCRQRDWGTAVWDSANRQIILWGGGHCVRSASCPLHYSPRSGRMVEGYDADEPYSANGNGGYGSSLLNRPWAGVHGYNLYAYDPKCGLVVSARGYLYDPALMDWRRDGPAGRPFRYAWSSTVLEATPHGAVAWAQAADGERYGLWLFDRQGGWTDLKPKGKLDRPYCDSEGMTYDARRDRLLLGWGGGYMKAGDGRLTAFDFATRKVERIDPANADLGRIRNTREMVYLDHADWVAFAEPLIHGDAKTGKPYLRIYDCAGNRYGLLDAGQGPAAAVHSQGWCYDAKRRLVIVITYRGDVWALRLDPATARLLAKP